MSQQSGRPHNPVFKRPINLDIVQAYGLPKGPEPLSSQAIYVVCVDEDGQTGRLPADKDFTIQFFGYLENLGFEENQTDSPLIFDHVIENIRNKNGAPTAQMTVWATSDLATPAELISSDEQLQDAIYGHFSLVRQEEPSYLMLYFFVELDRPSGTIPSASNREYIPQPFLQDDADSYIATGGVSPRQIPIFDNGDDPNRIHVPEDETESPNDRPVTTPVQPKRSNTLESGKKAMSKLTIAVKNAAGSVKDLVSPRSAPEQHTVLTELASGIEEEDYLTSLLPTTNGRPEHQADINDYQAQMFARFARFFPHIDPNQRENTRSIRFRHTALAVTPHQFVRAMEILFQDHTTGLAGGFLGSEMGSGKSIIILCAVAIRSLLFQSKLRTEREWEEVDTSTSSPKKKSSSRHAQRLEHLPRDAPRGQGLTCPTQRHRPHDVICFCVPDGATRREISVLKPGAALIHVPSAAMPGWLEILESGLFSRIAYNFTVLYAGPTLSSRLQPSPDFLGGTRFNRFSMGAVLPEGHPGGLITDTRELDWFTQPAPLSERSTMALETYIVVTSHITRLRELFMWDIKDLSPAPQNCSFPPGGLYAYPLGIAFFDEAHKALEENLQIAREHRHIYTTPSAVRRPMDVWLVSGTPFGARLEDLAAAVSFLAPDRAHDARALHTTYDAIKPAITNTPRAMFETLFDKVFGGQLVIRDDANTTFLGSRVSDVQRVRPQYVSRNTPENQLHFVRMIIDTKVSKGPRDAYFDTLVKLKQNTELLYLLSMFPSAAKLLLETQDVAFTDLDTRRTIRKEKNTAGESLIAHKDFRSLAEKLTRGSRSPKLQYILDELERMAKDVTPRPQGSRAGASANVQSDLTLKKMVIITPTLFTAVMLYVILARYHPRSGPLLYHEDLKQSQRSDVLRRFNSLHKRDGPWRCLVAPASVASEALNLQIANRLILTSPLLNIHQQNQALARVNRAGQVFDVELKILLLEDSPLDRIVVAHRASANLESDPFNVDASVSVSV